MHWVRASLLTNPEMVQHLVSAAQERLRDAQAALTTGSPTGSVYLAGYGVEMVLKHAAFRVEGLRPDAKVRDALAPARARLWVWLGPIDHEGYHSLEFWALLLRETFRHRRHAVPAIVRRAVESACHLHQCWQVALRYRTALVGFPDASEFLRSAGWFTSNANELWR